MYLDDENPELENRILHQDFSDLPNPYDDGQLEKILSSQRALGRKYPDLNEYNLPDYQNDAQLISPYYMQQSNLGNERFYPLDYRQAPERYAVVKKPKSKKFNPWTDRYSIQQRVRPKFSNENVNKRRRRNIYADEVVKTFKKEKFCKLYLSYI